MVSLDPGRAASRGKRNISTLKLTKSLESWPGSPGRSRLVEQRRDAWTSSLRETGRIGDPFNLREVGGVIPVGVEDCEGGDPGLGVARSVIERAMGTSMKFGGGGCRGPGEDWRTPPPQAEAVPSGTATRSHAERSNRRIAVPHFASVLDNSLEVPAWGLLASAPRAGRRVHRIRIGAERGLRLTDRRRAPRVSAALSRNLKESPSAEPEGCQGGASR